MFEVSFEVDEKIIKSCSSVQHHVLTIKKCGQASSINLNLNHVPTMSYTMILPAIGIFTLDPEVLVNRHDRCPYGPETEKYIA